MNVIAEYKYDKSSRDQNEAEAGIKEFLSEQLKRRLNNVECMTGVVTVNAKVARTGMVSIENMSVVSTNGVGMALAKRVEQTIKQAPFVNVQGLNESLPLTLEVVFAKKGLDGKVDTDVAPEKISADAVWVIGEETAPSNAVVVEKQTAGEKFLLSRSDMLVIIDGKEGKIDDIPHDDVESFRVLNREEATKLFGEKGKNGAVLFNTKLFYENERTESAEKSEEDTPFVKVEKMPTFQGGDFNKFRNWVQSNVKYPQEAQEKALQGRVVFSFVVEKDGSVSEFQALQSPDKVLTDEVERVFKTSPKWEPGEQLGEKVIVKYIVPIVFQIKQ